MRYPPQLSALGRHLVAAASFAIATAIWLWPLIGLFTIAIPGAGAGDNITFVWNVWWVRYAVTHHLPLLSSPMLLYPFGADLTLHTHTLLPALAVSGVTNPAVAQNLLIAAHLFLNFACTYLLAWRETRAWASSIVAAAIFGWSPYLAAHLTGHFNLIAAWVLPLSALLARKAIGDSRLSSGILLGLTLGATAYIDYYYFVYACLLAFLLGVASCVTVVQRPSPIAVRTTAVSMRVLGVAALLALASACLIAFSGGSVWEIRGRTISVRSIRNPVATAWLCGLVALFIYLVRTRSVRFDWRVISRSRRWVVPAVLVPVLVLLPLLWHAIVAVRTGVYVSQQYLWRSAPAGVDLLTLLSGNPSSALYGGFVRPIYDAWNIDLVEHVGWIGPGAIVLAVIGAFTAGSGRRWLLPLTIFGAWALGPLLEVAGHSTPLWLPAVLVRWIPIIANARIPSRAIVVVYLACALLAAHGMRQLLLQRRTAAAWGLLALVLVDFAPAAPPVFRLPRPHIAAAIASDPAPGAVLPVPFGLRDGFGETGRLDPAAMWLQTIHHRAIAGGFVARLPRDINERYRQMPVIGPLLQLSNGEPSTPRTVNVDRTAAATLTKEGFRYVVLNRGLASHEVQQYIERLLAVAPIAEDGDYTVYALERATSSIDAPRPGRVPAGRTRLHHER